MIRTPSILCCAVLLLSGEAAWAAPGPRPPAARPQLHDYADLAITPAGDRLATVESAAPLEALDKGHSAIVLRDTATGAVIGRSDPCRTCDYAALTWSPDGRTLLFLAADDKSGVSRLEALQDGRLRTLTTIKGVANTPRWSPDGSRIALLTVLGAHKKTGATQAGAALVGEIGSTPDEQRIAVLPASGGAPRLVSPADTFVYEYDWTPDGRGWVATAAKGDGDNNWWVAKLVAVDAQSGGLRVLAAPPYQMNFPRVSPDGRSVAFIGGLMSDFGSVGGDLYTIPRGGGEPRDLTPGYRGSFTSLSWNRAGLLTTALAGDRAAVVTVSPAGEPRTLWSAPVGISGGDTRVVFSGDGLRGATVAQTFEHAPRILAGPIAALAQVTHDNDALVAPVSARSVNWRSDGFDVQGWLLAPAQAAPGKRPMVTVIHGGPSAAHTPNFLGGGSFSNRTIRTLLSRGYFVFQPNPRGSYGQGEAFTRANVRDLGGGDLHDILKGIDAVERIAPVDDARLGVFGHSYGGFMTMWTVTHSQRFKAAVAGAGIANWVSYYGQNGIDQWMIPFFGASAYDDPAIYDKLSPIRSIKGAHTPTLIYVGERDVECPPAQSIEFWHGLRAVGTPTSLVIYEGEGHRIRKPEHIGDLERRMVDWLDRYLGGASPSRPPR